MHYCFWQCLGYEWLLSLILFNPAHFAGAVFEGCSDPRKGFPYLFPLLSLINYLPYSFGFLFSESYQLPLYCLPPISLMFLRASLGLNLAALFQIKSVPLAWASELSVLGTCLTSWRNLWAMAPYVGQGWHPCLMSRVLDRALWSVSMCFSQHKSKLRHWGFSILALLCLMENLSFMSRGLGEGRGNILSSIARNLFSASHCWREWEMLVAILSQWDTLSLDWEKREEGPSSSWPHLHRVELPALWAARREEEGEHGLWPYLKGHRILLF